MSIIKKLFLIVFLLTIFLSSESNAFIPDKFISNCELKDGMFGSSFTNFDKEDIKRFKNKILSLKIDTTLNTVMSNNDNLEILHGISESEKLINYEELMINKYGKKDWEKTWKKYEDMYAKNLFWISELVIQEEPLIKYKYEGKICLICRNEDFFKIEIVEWSMKEMMGSKGFYPQNLKNPYTLTPECKWKPFTN